MKKSGNSGLRLEVCTRRLRPFGVIFGSYVFAMACCSIALADAIKTLKRSPSVASPKQQELPDPLRPARQAQTVGLGACASMLELIGKQTLTRSYDLQPGWSRDDPSHHVFQSVAALSSPKNNPPDGLTALVAAPVAGGCDGVAMQVFPLAGDCEKVERTMLKTGKLLASMMNTRIMIDAQGNRVILLPATRKVASQCPLIAASEHRARGYANRVVAVRYPSTKLR